MVLWLAFGAFSLSLFGQTVVQVALWVGRRSVCSRCEYDLTGLREAKCPECAEPIDRRGPTFAQQLLVLLAAGIVTTVWTGCCYQAWYRGSTLTYLLASDRGLLPPNWSPLNPSWAWMAILIAVTVWFGGLFITVYRARRRIGRSVPRAGSS